MSIDINERVRLAVYRGLADSGCVPDLNALAAENGLMRSELDEVVKRLSDAHHFGLRDGKIVLAHPFATQSFGFSVMSASTLWWGGCCWDAFAIPHLLATASPSLIATTCPACHAPHAWRVVRERPPSAEQIAHFLTPMRRVWDDVVHACSHQRIFCNHTCLADWLDSTGNTEGYSMPIEQLWRLASNWYEGRLEPNYRRRHPPQAANYFRSVGLTGPFWEA